MPHHISEFSQWLKEGKFFILLELTLPKDKPDIPVFNGILNKLQKIILSPGKAFEVGIAFSDNSGQRISDFSEFLSGLPPELTSKSLFYLSGRNNNLKNLSLQIESLKRLGLNNIAAVSGERRYRKREEKTKERYIDSVNALESLSADKDLFCGAVVNPFKYTPEESYMQYYKLMKKIRCGAQFISVQAGWDMKKLQEVRWFLENRDCHVPTIARTIILTPELAEEIFTSVYPGLIMSDDIKQILNNECKYGHTQFASAQWRRLQIISGGARILGYSGIQVAGLERPEHAESVLAKIAEAVDEFKSFEDWRDEYQDHLSRAEPAPFPYNFYMFENLFKWQYPEGKIKLREIKKCDLSLWQKIKYQICSAILSKSHRQVPEEHLLIKKILLGCKTCKYCRVSLTHYVCPETCPKGLANGPCGGSFAGGLCEFRNQKCIYLQIFKNALWMRDVSSPEERIIKPPE